MAGVSSFLRHGVLAKTLACNEQVCVCVCVCVCVQIKFRDVKLMEVQRRRITLTNIGNV